MSTPDIPRHLAIIMDGNGRWAIKRRRPRMVGHRAGGQAARRAVDFCLQQGIQTLTLFAFSSENWGRPKDEVNALMKLFLRALEREVDELDRREVRLRFIGERERFPANIQSRMRDVEQHTRAYQHLFLNIAASYGGQQDIAGAARALAREVAAGRLDPEQIDAPLLGAHVALADLPPPDLFIRTGGECRISNFLLWQLAYTELWFTDTLWPDVDTTVLQQALGEYAKRERRFGLTSEQLIHLPQGATPP